MNKKDQHTEPSNEAPRQQPEELDDEQARALGRRIAEVLHLDCWRGRHATSFGSKTDIGLGHTVANVVDEFKTSSSDVQQNEASSGIIDNHTIECMERRGGSFAKALARCYEFADSGNRKRLQTAFDELFARYSEEASSAPVEKERVK